MIAIRLAAYLNRLRGDEEYKRESERRFVPTYGELAEEVGISPVTMSRIANGHVKQLNLETADAIITALRKRGFAMEISNLLVYYPPESA